MGLGLDFAAIPASQSEVGIEMDSEGKSPKERPKDLWYPMISYDILWNPMMPWSDELYELESKITGDIRWQNANGFAKTALVSGSR